MIHFLQRIGGFDEKEKERKKKKESQRKEGATFLFFERFLCAG